jgi:hypothetical protein
MQGCDGVAKSGGKRQEREPGGITYDRFRTGRLLEALVRRLDLRTAVEVPAGGAKACPSLYSLPLALAGCHVTLVNPFEPALEGWRDLGLSNSLTLVRSTLESLPFSDASFHLAWNFVTLGREESMVPILREMGRVASAVLVIQQNGYNLGYPWHRLLHRLFSIPWNHGQTRFFFPAETRREMAMAGLVDVEVGLLDQAPWPDPPGPRDLRLHWAGTDTSSEAAAEWAVPAVDHWRERRFPWWMRLLGSIEDLPVPLALRWPFNHLYWALGFPPESPFRSRREAGR